MTQSPFDQLAKQYLEDFLTPIGAVERQYEIPGEARYVDVWFTPNLPITVAIDDLGLLREIAKSPALIEPYSNPPTRDDRGDRGVGIAPRRSSEARSNFAVICGLES